MTNIKTINPDELKNWLENLKDVNVVDIRNDAEREEWFIPNSIHFNAYDKLKAGDKTAMDGLDLDKSKPIVTVCAGGRMSLVAAEQLQNKGYNTYSLDGGMKAWNYAWDTSTIILDNVKVIQVKRVAKGCLSYIVGSGNQAMVIDAALNPEVYATIAKEQGWTITHVADTHIHADYVSRTRELATAEYAKHVMIHSAAVDYDFISLQDGEIIKIGNAEIKTIHTPGHTLESTSFLINNKAVLTGDTLFTDGVGRPDLKANEAEAKIKADALYDSLQTLLALGDDTLILPAHISEPISIGDPLIANAIKEIKKTINVLSFNKTEFRTNVLSNLPDSPPNYLTIAEINRSGNRIDLEIPTLEAGANRCAVK
jgi:glyoxylase-like metal-dependent hydrolase (beta-lactamase superfamily II)